MAKVHTYGLLVDEENQKPPGCSRTIDKMDSWSERIQWQYELCPMICSLPMVPSRSYMVPQTGEGGNTRAGSNFEQSASLVTITDHNKLNHNKIPRATTNHVVPGEHMCWGPRKESSHRSGGWKTCQWNQVNLATSNGCNILWFFYFSCFSCQILLFLFPLLANASGWLGTTVFMNWFIIWGFRPDRLDQNQRCEVEIQHAEIHRDETSRASILQSTATSSRGTGSRSHLHLGRKRGICWFPIFWGKAGRSENLQSENELVIVHRSVQ